MTLRALDIDAQLKDWADRAQDARGVVPTGWSELDDLLRRGGFSPATFVVLGGRTGTRKTTVACNLVGHFLDQGLPVGVVGLDESTVNYTAKIAGAMLRYDDEWLEDHWTDPRVKPIIAEFRDRAQRLQLAKGYRPDFDKLTLWLDECQMFDPQHERPRVVFVDYTSLLARGKYDRGEGERVMRMVEELHRWTKENELVTIALHQVGKSTDDFSSHAYHGDTPMAPESLKYAGEEIADVVLGTYRPAKNRLGNLSRDSAVMALGDSFDEEKWMDAVARVKRYWNSTFLQLLKNRPGRKTNEQGIELESPGDSMYMRQKSDGIDATGARVKGETPEPSYSS